MNLKTGHSNFRKKIVFVLNELAFGGTTKGVLTFCRHLDKTQFEPYVFCYSEIGSLRYYRRKLEGCFSRSKKDRFQKIYLNNYIRKHEFQELLGSDHLFFGQLNDLKTLLKERQVDLLHFNRGEAQDWYTDVCWSKEFPLTKFTETSIFGLPSNNDYVTGLDRIFFISDWLKGRSVWDQGKGVVLYNPILPPQSTEDLRREIGLPRDSLVVGRISRPGLDDGLRALEIFNKSLREYKGDQKKLYYLVLGASPELLSLAKTNPQIIPFKASTDEVWISRFYNSLDVLLHYRVEGETFGMNIAEAMIHGKPVVTHLSYLDNAQKELLEMGEKPSGLVCPQDDTDLQSRLLAQLLNDSTLRLNLANQAKVSAWQHFEASKVTSALQTHYLQLLA